MFDSIQSLNILVTQFFYGIATQHVSFEYAAIFLSDGIFVLSIAAYVIAIMPLRKKGIYSWTLWRDSAPAVLAGVVAFITKLTTDISRPFVVLGFDPFVPQPDPHGSFPSWHLAVFTAFACTLAQRYRKLGILLVSLIPLVAIGRIAIGVHWLTDVCAGVFIGCIAAYRIPIRNAKQKLSQHIVQKVAESAWVQKRIEKRKKHMR
jgi:membrane-associated phospholipid phosphatase